MWYARLVLPVGTLRGMATTTQPVNPPAVMVAAKRSPNGETGRPYFEAKWRDEQGRQVKRRIGPAWLVAAPDGDGDYGGGRYKARRGKPAAGYLTERMAIAEAVALQTRATVERAEADKVAAAEAVAAADAEASFRAYAWRHIERCEGRGLRASTVRGYRLEMRQGGFLDSVLGDLRADAVTTADIERALKLMADTPWRPPGAKAERKRSARTVNKARVFIGSVYAGAVKRGELAHNPVVASERRREDSPAARRYLTPDEIERVAQAMEAHQRRNAAGTVAHGGGVGSTVALSGKWFAALDGEAVRIAGHTGLRMAELLALRWDAVDFERRVVDVIEAKSRKGRSVPLDVVAYDALQRLAGRGVFAGPTDYVMAGESGAPISGDSLRARFQRAAVDCCVAGAGAARHSGGRPLVWHDLRHSALSNLLAGDIAAGRAGEDLATVRKIAGHASIVTTQRYVHALSAEAIAARWAANAAGGADAAETERR